MRKASLMALLLALTMLLAACSGGNGGKDGDKADKGPEYPVLELPDISGLELTDAKGEDASLSFVGDKWEYTGDAPMQFYLYETIEDSTKVNVLINYEADLDDITDDDLEDVKSAMLSEEMSFLKANAAEFRTVDGEKVMYIDIGISDKRAYVDYIMEGAGLTEEDLEPFGGVEGLLELMPPTNQMMFYFIKDGHMFSLTGMYFTESQKNDILELFACVFSTIKAA